MTEFLYDLCDSEEEFLAIGYYLNKLIVSNRRYLYIPRYLTYAPFMSQTKRLQSNRAFKFLYLKDIIAKFTPTLAIMKFNCIIHSYGGQKIYIPDMESFRRYYRNSKILCCRQKGFTYKTLSIMFDLSITALRYIVDSSLKKTGKLH